MSKKKTNPVRLPALVLPCLLLGAPAGAAPASGGADLLDLSLDDLLNLPVAAASRKPLPARETPGVVTVLDGEEIRRSGARDLVDVLRMVPGYDFRLIVNNILGLGVRGHIGSDARVLMLVDGVEANEHRFGTAQFGLSFPIENIRRIEIVRGSALAMYGGAAEMGVINIVTRGAAELAGAEVSGTLGGVDSGRQSRAQFSAAAGLQSGAVSLSAHVAGGRALRSDQRLAVRGGASYDMGEQDGVSPRYANIGLGIGKFRLRYLEEDTEVDSRLVGDIQADAWSVRQRAQSLLAATEWSLSEALTISPSLLWQSQSPRETRNPQGALTSQTRVERNQAKLGLAWSAGAPWHLAAGIDAVDEKYSAGLRPFPLRALAYERLSVNGLYGELLHRADWGDLTLGSRRDEHQYAGSLWSHRLAYTRVAGDWHVKLLASAAQRAPSVEDYSAGSNGLALRKNESVRSAELEIGYRFDAGTQLSVNLFDILTRDTLILNNTSDVRTRGLEAVLQLRRDWGRAEFNVSTYAAGGTDSAMVSVIDASSGTLLDGQAVLGFSPWKLAASGGWRLKDGVWLSPSVVVYGPRWIYDVDASTASVSRLRQAPTATLLNLALQWDELGAKGLSLNLAVHNLLAAKTQFAAPFATTAPPVPDMGREWVARLVYRF